MSTTYERLEELCAQRQITLTDLCRDTNVARSTLSDYKAGRRKSLNLQILQRFADYFQVSIDDIIGKKEPALTKKDERDIEKKMNALLGELEGAQDGLMYSGQALDPETRQLLAESLKNSMRMAKLIAKEKYTPKKYRDTK